MTVKDFIEYLQEQPQDIKVAYYCCSEQCLLDTDDIDVMDLCEERIDGWIQNKRPDKKTEKYLVLPGN